MRTNDGLELRSRAPAAIVTELRLGTFDAPRTDRAFMREVARRSRFLGHDVRFDNPDNFVADLLKAGLLLDE